MIISEWLSVYELLRYESYWHIKHADITRRKSFCLSRLLTFWNGMYRQLQTEIYCQNLASLIKIYQSRIWSKCNQNYWTSVQVGVERNYMSKAWDLTSLLQIYIVCAEVIANKEVPSLAVDPVVAQLLAKSHHHQPTLRLLWFPVHHRSMHTPSRQIHRQLNIYIITSNTIYACRKTKKCESKRINLLP